MPMTVLGMLTVRFANCVRHDKGLDSSTTGHVKKTTGGAAGTQTKAQTERCQMHEAGCVLLMVSKRDLHGAETCKCTGQGNCTSIALLLHFISYLKSILANAALQYGCV